MAPTASPTLLARTRLESDGRSKRTEEKEAEEARVEKEGVMYELAGF